MKALRFKLIALAYLGVSLLLPSCTCSEVDRTMFLSAVSGKAGEVEVIADKSLWNSEIGETLRTILSSEYPFLPQPEPAFNLLNISVESFSRLSAYQIHRNILFVDVNATKYSEAKMTSQRDTWASPQIIIKLTGPTSESIVSLLNEQKNRLWSLLEQAEVDRQSSNAQTYADAQLGQMVRDKFGIRLSIPQGYRKNKPLGNPSDFMWFGYDTNRASTGIFVYSYPYTDTAQFSLKALNDKRQELLKQYVPSSREGSYMMTSPYVEPEYTPMTYKGTFIGRLRGLWRVHNGYMGGPFVAYSMIVGNKIVTVEGYVYAPKTEKRNYVRQMLGMLTTMVPEKQAETNTSAEK